MTLSPGLGPLEPLSTYLKWVVTNPISNAPLWDCSLCISHYTAILSNLHTQRKALSSPVDAKTVSRRDNSSKVRETVNSENKIYSRVKGQARPGIEHSEKNASRKTRTWPADVGTCPPSHHTPQSAGREWSGCWAHSLFSLGWQTWKVGCGLGKAWFAFCWEPWDIGLSRLCLLGHGFTLSISWALPRGYRRGAHDKPHWELPRFFYCLWVEGLQKDVCVLVFSQWVGNCILIHQLLRPPD